MCDAMRMPLADLGDSLVRCYNLADYVAEMSGVEVVTFRESSEPRFIPYLLNGQLELADWGARVKLSDVENLTAYFGQIVEPPRAVNVPAFEAQQNGCWYRVSPREIRGVLVYKSSAPSVSVLVKPASDYYERMTHCEWEPVYVGEDADPATDFEGYFQ